MNNLCLSRRLSERTGLRLCECVCGRLTAFWGRGARQGGRRRSLRLEGTRLARRSAIPAPAAPEIISIRLQPELIAPRASQRSRVETIRLRLDALSPRKLELCNVSSLIAESGSRRTRKRTRVLGNTLDVSDARVARDAVPVFARS